jgi:cytochrome P450
MIKSPPLAKPPGPIGWPLGATSLAFRKTPAEFLLQLAREYGDVAHFRAGFGRYYLLNRPDLIEEVLITNADSFEVSTIFRPHANPVANGALSREVLTRYGAAAVEGAGEVQAVWRAGQTRDMHQEIRRIIGAIAHRSEISAETTAAALTWTLYLLSENAEVDGRLREEVRRVLGDRAPCFEDLPQLPYMEMVFSEVLRLYPPVWAVARTVRRHYRLFNYGLSPRSTCLMSPYIMHRHPRYYRDPERFDPERFTPEQQQSRPKFAWFPFGQDSDTALAERSVFLEGMLVLAVLVQNWRMRIAPGQTIERRSVCDLRPRRGLQMVLEK